MPIEPEMSDNMTGFTGVPSTLGKHDRSESSSTVHIQVPVFNPHSVAVNSYFNAGQRAKTTSRAGTRTVADSYTPTEI